MRRYTVLGVLALLVLLVPVAALLLSCGGGGGSGSSDGGSGTVSMSITDAKPVIPGNPSELWITFKEILAHKPGGDWVSLPLPETPLSINLLAFSNGETTELVPPVQLDSGKYTQLRFVVSRAFMIIDGSHVEIDLDVPSGFLRTDKNFTFDVPNGGAVDLTVDFDLSQSIVVTGSPTDPQYKLKPVLHLVETHQAATIRGTIPAAAFGSSTEATVTVWWDKNTNCTLDLPPGPDADAEYTKVTVTKTSDTEPTAFNIFWLVPDAAYIVQIQFEEGGNEFLFAVPGTSDDVCQTLPPGAVFDLATIQGKIAAATFGTSDEADVIVTWDKDASGTVTAGDVTYTKVKVPNPATSSPAVFSILVLPNEAYVVQIEVNSTLKYQEAIPASEMPVGVEFKLNGDNSI